MKHILFFLSFALIVTGCSQQQTAQLEQGGSPNIIFVMLDDLGYSQVSFNSKGIDARDYDPLFLEFELAHNDYQPEKALQFSRLATPTLSRMADEGMVFTNAFTSSNLCAPSRIGIATGVLQNRMGIYRNVDCEERGPDPGSLLVERLQDNGYATAHIGKWHIGKRDGQIVARGFEKHGISDSAGHYPNIYEYPEIKKEVDALGYMGSCIPEHHPLNNGFDYYYGYNTWESPFYNADNVWEGFEHMSENPTYNTDLFTDKAIEFIDESLDSGKPFYVQLHYHAVHSPLEPKAPDVYYDRFDSKSFVLNNFYAHMYAVDQNIRKLENHLKEKGEAENTVIVFTSDNGGAIGGASTLPGNAPYRGQKGMYLMGGIKVPLLFYWPNKTRVAEKNNHLVSTLDILPTVLDAAGIAPPENIDGKSLLPYLNGASDKPVHDYLLWSGIHARTWGFMKQNNIFSELKSRDQAPYAWVVVKDGFALRHIAETKEGLYKDLPNGKPSYYELYNILDDPGEKKDLVVERPELMEALKSIWEKEAASFPNPVKIGQDKWEMIKPKNVDE